MKYMQLRWDFDSHIEGRPFFRFAIWIKRGRHELNSTETNFETSLILPVPIPDKEKKLT